MGLILPSLSTELASDNAALLARGEEIEGRALLEEMVGNFGTALPEREMLGNFGTAVGGRERLDFILTVLGELRIEAELGGLLIELGELLNLEGDTLSLEGVMRLPFLGDTSPSIGGMMMGSVLLASANLIL